MAWQQSICCFPKDRQSSNPLTANILMATTSITHSMCLLTQQALALATWILSPKDSADDRKWDENWFSVICCWFFFSLTAGLPERCIDILSTARGQHAPTIKQVSCSSAEKVPLPQPAAALAQLQTLAGTAPCTVLHRPNSLNKRQPQPDPVWTGNYNF